MRVLGFRLGVCIAATWSVVQAALADENGLTPREQEMLEMIQRLEERVEELESRLESREATAPGAPGAMPPDSALPPGQIEDTDEPAAEPDDPNIVPLDPRYREGFRLFTDNNEFSIYVGGRIHLDWAWFDQDESLERVFGDEDDGVGFRRLRLNFRGHVYRDVYYRAEIDFANDSETVEFNDVYVGIRHVPWVGSVYVGHMREPIGIEQQETSNTITFLERGIQNALLPDRSVGLRLRNAFLDDRMTWALGAFKDTDDVPSDNDSDEDQGYAITGRLTALPWYADEGRKLLHLGAAFSLRNPDGAPLRYRSRPDASLAYRYVDTGLFPGFTLLDARADDVRLTTAEAALSLGPVGFQGEYIRSDVDSTFGGDLAFDGYSLQAYWFLTGEHRPYRRSSGLFGRTSPKNNFYADGSGWGAWQLALRYSSLDLTDGPVRGGQVDTLTFGVNWYLNPMTRVMVNYIMGDVEHDFFSGDVNTLTARIQFEF